MEKKNGIDWKKWNRLEEMEMEGGNVLVECGANAVRRC